jgi:DNA-binding transcriptional LysR family regulator
MAISSCVKEGYIMELRELKSFCLAARFRSISKAAEKLSLGQPTVSTHIKKLENELGFALFDRVKRPFQLTHAGQSLLRLASPLVEGVESLKTETVIRETHAPISVGAVHDMITHPLIKAVTTFHQEYHEAYIKIRSGVQGEIVELVSEGEVDFGLVIVPVIESRLSFIPLFDFERVLITPRGHPLSEGPLTDLEQISKWPLIVIRRGSNPNTLTMIETFFQRRGLPYQVVMQLDSIEMAKRYVARGVGITVGTRVAVERGDEQSLGIVSLAGLLPNDYAGIVTLNGRTMTEPAINFMSVIRETLAETLSGY